jgi:hypothetical protein
LGQFTFHSDQMGGDEGVADFVVRCAEYRFNFLDGHVETSEATNDLRSRDLSGRVAAVPGSSINIGGFK